MPSHILLGDSFLVSRALRELQSLVGPPELLEANSHRLSRSELDPAQVGTLCNAVPFLAAHRLVVLEGLLSQFNAREGRRRTSTQGPRRSSASTGQGNLASWEYLPRYIAEEMPPTTLLVFLEESVSRGNALLEKLRTVVKVQEYPTPSGEALARWIRNSAAEKGARIAPGAIRLLAQVVGGNLWAMDTELEKLDLYTEDRDIQEGDVRLLVSQAREVSIFAAIDALLEGRSGTALGLMNRLRQDGVDFPHLVSMIARQLRLVTLAQDLADNGRRHDEIRDRLGISHDFALKRTMEQAKRHSWSSLKQLYEKLMDADVAVKQGKLEQGIALELLVGEVSNPRIDSGRGVR